MGTFWGWWSSRRFVHDGGMVGMLCEVSADGAEMGSIETDWIDSHSKLSIHSQSRICILSDLNQS